MRTDFRHGIAKIADGALVYNGGDVSLTVNEVSPIQLTFAHSSENYFFEIAEPVNNAWEGVSEGDYLYVEVDPSTGNLIYGKTAIPPIINSGFIASPLTDQYVFNLQKMTGYTYSNSRWSVKHRLYIASYQGGLVYFEVGSQASTDEDTLSGEILLRSGHPVYINNGSTDPYLLNTASNIFVRNLQADDINENSVVSVGKVNKPVEPFHAVTFTPDGIETATYKNPSLYAIGISTTGALPGAPVEYKTSGVMRNDLWNFEYAPTSQVFVGLNGEITPYPPRDTSIQPVGRIIDSRTISIDIQEVMVMDKAVDVSVTPTITPTATVTTTTTPTLTPTPTPTETLSNIPPIFTSAPIEDAVTSEVYTYNIATSDNISPQHINVITVDTVLPYWLTLTDNGDNTATLTGTPTIDDDQTSVNITIRATDPGGLFTTQSFVISVTSEFEHFVWGASSSYGISKVDASGGAMLGTGPLPIQVRPRGIWSDGEVVFTVTSGDTSSAPCKMSASRFNGTSLTKPIQIHNISEAIGRPAKGTMSTYQLTGVVKNGASYFLIEMYQLVDASSSALYLVKWENNQFSTVDFIAWPVDVLQFFAQDVIDGDFVVAVDKELKSFSINPDDTIEVKHSYAYTSSTRSDFRVMEVYGNYLALQSVNDVGDVKVFVGEYDAVTGFREIYTDESEGYTHGGVHYDGEILIHTEGLAPRLKVLTVDAVTGASTVVSSDDTAAMQHISKLPSGQYLMVSDKTLRFFSLDEGAYTLSQYSSLLSGMTANFTIGARWQGLLKNTHPSSAFLENGQNYFYKNHSSVSHDPEKLTLTCRFEYRGDYILDGPAPNPDQNIFTGFFDTSSGRFLKVYINDLGQMVLSIHSTAESLLEFKSNTGVITENGVYNLLISIDASTDTVHMYVNDVDVISNTVGDPVNYDFSLDAFIFYSIGTDQYGTGQTSSRDFGLLHLSMDDTYHDFDQESTRRRFFNASDDVDYPGGIPAYGGEFGQIAYEGHVPKIWAPNGNPTENKGTIGGFISDGNFQTTPPQITSISGQVNTATVGVAFSDTITIKHIDQLTVVAVTVVSKPSWMTITDDGERSVILSGTPDAIGTVTVDIILGTIPESGTKTYTYDIEVT